MMNFTEGYLFIIHISSFIIMKKSGSGTGKTPVQKSHCRFFLSKTNFSSSISKM